MKVLQFGKYRLNVYVRGRNGNCVLRNKYLPGGLTLAHVIAGSTGSWKPLSLREGVIEPITVLRTVSTNN